MTFSRRCDATIMNILEPVKDWVENVTHLASMPSFKASLRTSLLSSPLDNKSLNFAHLLLVDAKNILNILLEYQRPRSSLLFSSKTTSTTTWKCWRFLPSPSPILASSLPKNLDRLSNQQRVEIRHVLLTTKTSSSCICLKTKSVLVVERGKKKQLA